MRDATIALVEEENSPEAKELIKNLVTFNDLVAPRENWESYLLVAKDCSGELIGGVKGYTHWDWLFVSHLWVCEASRGSGLGTALVNRAEDLARKRNCKHAWLDTFSFQAREFYVKCGYQEFAKLENFPPGYSRHFLRKKLI